jgi:flavin reductase (DIM6/NTAB) family NADH-FMN oxidoreductase RutF
MAMMEAMKACAVPFAPEIGELQEAGLKAMEGTKVPCPWIALLPAAFECRHHSTMTISHSREIILGEIVHAHFHAEVINTGNFHIDPAALDAVGRMGGHGYATTRDYFDLPTLSVGQWQARSTQASER